MQNSWEIMKFEKKIEICQEIKKSYAVSQGVFRCITLIPKLIKLYYEQRAKCINSTVNENTSHLYINNFYIACSQQHSDTKSY